MGNFDPGQAVRQSTGRVIQRARSVRLCGERLAAFARTLDEARVRAAYRWDREYHYSGDEATVIDYVFTVNAMNFGSGFLPQWQAEPLASTYKPVAAALKRRIKSGGRCDANFAANATPRHIGRLLGMPEGFELATLYARSLTELGRWVLERYGDYAALLARLDPRRRVAALVEELASNLSGFDDRAEYDGAPVHFYKRAQILVSDLHLALGGRGAGSFDDIDALTMFANSLVPHVLRLEGVLEYAPTLTHRIERSEPLAPGCPEEVEIRAGAVQAVEELCRELRDEHGWNVFPAMVDAYLWNVGQDARYKSRPRHLCRTVFY
ncbi:MAG TPA: queuosine salvage family protein [Burkholderiaceae bacterium]|nr:queuosine salvage family protein [Burkholderiaceae bacterium]